MDRQDNNAADLGETHNPNKVKVVITTTTTTTTTVEAVDVHHGARDLVDATAVVLNGSPTNVEVEEGKVVMVIEKTKTVVNDIWMVIQIQDQMMFHWWK